MSKIGANIKAARQRANLNQSQIAKKAGITKAAISRYESGLREPRAEQLKAIAEALETTTDELLGIAPLPALEMPLYEGSNEKQIISSYDREYAAFDAYLESMGYRTVINMGPDNPNCGWTIYDDRKGKKYYAQSELLDKLMNSINSFAKFQIATLLAECETEKVPDATNIQD